MADEPQQSIRHESIPHDAFTQEPYEPTHEGGGPLKYIAGILIGALILGGGFLLYDMQNRVKQLEAGNAESQKKMEHRVAELEASVKASNEALTSRLGMTQEQLAKRTEELRRQQHAAETRIAREQEEKLGVVSGQIESVKGEVGGVKTDVGTVRSDLETNKSKLDRAIGDLGQQSGLIARTRDDLEYLKHRGDRNIYEFTLAKSKRPTPVSTVSLELKKVDQKKGKFTLNVISDDRTIEKKDRTLFEPMQFYTGRDRLLYEVVVLTVGKDKITGYMSTPKTAPVPPTAQPPTAQ